MNELAIPFTIPNLEEIQSELLLAIDHDYKAATTTTAFTYPAAYMLQHCPKFMSWLMPKARAPIRLFRYYITPPHTRLAAHVDGVNPTSPFGINIPVTGTKNTYHCFYDTPPDNIIYPTPQGGVYLKHISVGDHNKLNLIGEGIEVVRPYIMNNSVLHGVRNDTDQYRVMFTVRWNLFLRNIQDVIDTSDLMLDHSGIINGTYNKI